MHTELTFRILFALAFVVNAVIVGRYRRRAQAGEQFSLAEEGWIAIPLRLGGILLLIYVVTYIVAPSGLAWSLMTIPDALRAGGAAVALLVVPPFIHWAQSSLGTNVTTTVITREKHALVTHGPYRWIRHPLYTAGLVYYAALAVLAGSWLLMLLTVLAGILITIRLPKEEASLQARFGTEYETYRARTGRFLPRVK